MTAVSAGALGLSLPLTYPLTAIANIAAAATIVSDVIDLNALPVRLLSAQLEASGLTGTKDSTVQCQGSQDGVNFNNVGAAVTLASATQHSFMTDLFATNRAGQWEYRYVQFLVTKNTTSAGALQIYLHAR